MKNRLTPKQRKYIRMKRKLDYAAALSACIVLSPVLLFLCLAIKIDSRGPVFFKQKRVGIHKKYFWIYKFRTMRADTPKDIPTHLLENPDQYITKMGHFLRKSSLDELPQLFNILKGEMSFVGPRPALWNQDDLVAERERYGANDILPGLTGWAQINGRDELAIPVKAKLDGIYAKRMGFWFDIRCLLGTFVSVLLAEGVAEGKTEKKKKSPGASRTFLSCEKKILVIGENSYIGTSFARYAKAYAPNASVTLAGAKNGAWKHMDFSQYDVVLHAAAIVHQKEKKNMCRLYDKVNAFLPIRVAQKAKKSGVRQMVFLSTMAVYGHEPEMICAGTPLRPADLYAKSKHKAERGLRHLADKHFQVTIVRPPMVYGAGCPGNYARLAKAARLLPVFPQTDNRRSMIYIDNLCAYLLFAMQEAEGRAYRICCPQNAEYVNTAELVKEIRRAHGMPTFIVPGTKRFARLAAKAGGAAGKLFGSCCYEKEPSCGMLLPVGFRESIRETERM